MSVYQMKTDLNLFLKDRKDSEADGRRLEVGEKASRQKHIEMRTDREA